MNWLRTGVFAAAVFGLASSAQAAITQLTFSGTGVVTRTENVNPAWGIDAGDPVTVSGLINLGDGSQPGIAPIVPDDFTGIIHIDGDTLRTGYQSFMFNVVGGGVSGNSLTQFVYGSAALTLVGGQLRRFDLYLDIDPDVDRLTNNSFSFNRFSTEIRGNWTFDGGDTSVPEPATWALMVGGFGLAGAGLRRRRQALAG